jgi:hypothetical protein
MDPQIRRWLIAMAIAIILFAMGMAHVGFAFDLRLGVRFWPKADVS